MSKQEFTSLYDDALSLLKQLIGIPSFSKEEQGTAIALQQFLNSRNILSKRCINNVWAVNKHFDSNKPTILLNSHHDTVKPNKDYTLDPFTALEKDGKLYGLGSNDAGASLVSLLAVFLHFYDRDDLKYNLVFAASAEEEISGNKGIEALLPELGKIDFAIVGEPTKMEMAIAEKGLMVVDCICKGKSGHAARDEGDNAIYKAMNCLGWFKNYTFSKTSPLLGPVKMTVTMINAGTQHNMVPAECHFTVDIRINECYTHEEILETIRQHVHCDVEARSMRLRSSSISLEHPIIKSGMQAGLKYYGSLTLSDKALMPFPALKMGPGDSARSHTADEFIYTDEIREGINTYIEVLNKIL